MSDEQMPAMVVEALRRGNKIEAIKILRLERKLQLKDAKDLVDDYIVRDPVLNAQFQKAQSEFKGKLVVWLLVLFAIGIGAYYLLAK